MENIMETNTYIFLISTLILIAILVFLWLVLTQIKKINELVSELKSQNNENMKKIYNLFENSMKDNLDVLSNIRNIASNSRDQLSSDINKGTESLTKAFEENTKWLVNSNKENKKEIVDTLNQVTNLEDEIT